MAAVAPETKPNGRSQRPSRSGSIFVPATRAAARDLSFPNPLRCGLSQPSASRQMRDGLSVASWRSSFPDKDSAGAQSALRSPMTTHLTTGNPVGSRESSTKSRVCHGSAVHQQICTGAPIAKGPAGGFLPGRIANMFWVARKNMFLVTRNIGSLTKINHVSV